MTDQTPGVRCRALTKLFGAVRAVDGVDVDVANGEIVALLGPSGCGKTTFLRLLAGFEHPDAGSIEIAGVDVAGRRPIPPERRRVGFVFQDFALFPHLTVDENIGYGLARLPRAQRRARVEDTAALVGLPGFGQRYPHELSGGQQQRVALARALAPEPSLVLLDEPFASLDADLRARVRAEVREILRAAGATAIFVTHDQQEAFEIADRVAVMNDGRFEQVGRPEEVYHTPATRFVADFVGNAGFLPVTVDGDRLASELGSFTVSGIEPGDGELMLRPEDIHLIHDDGCDATIIARHFHGPVNIATVRLASGRVVESAHTSQTVFAPGDRVRVEFRPDHLVLFRGEARAGWIPVRSRTGTDQPER